MRKNKDSSIPVVILGMGYTGKFLFDLAIKQKRRVYATSRFPDTHLSFINHKSRLFFDLNDNRTWINLPYPAKFIWCFPPLPQQTALTFAQQMSDKGCQFIILGSTSAYPSNPHIITNETVELDCSNPRVKSEESIRLQCGAIVLRLAGIYGPGRHVFDWIQKGKIKNSSRYVNLIHVEDVAELCYAALDSATHGSAYIISDGIPRHWHEIFYMATQHRNISVPFSSQANDLGKRLSSNKILEELGCQLKHPDLLKALDELEYLQKETKHENEINN